MSESKDQKDLPEKGPSPAVGGAAAAEDRRQPYEPPKLIKKRSVARATLGTPMGNTMTGNTMA